MHTHSMCPMPCLPLSTFVRKHAKMKAIVTDVLYLGVCFGQVAMTSYRCDINEQAHPSPAHSQYPSSPCHSCLLMGSLSYCNPFGICRRGFNKYQKCDGEVLTGVLSLVLPDFLCQTKLLYLATIFIKQRMKLQFFCRKSRISWGNQP